MMSPETRSLLNPGFGAHLISCLAEGHAEESGLGLPFLFAFIAPGLILHSESRHRLPKVITSKLSEWAGQNPHIVSQLPNRVKELKPMIGQSVLFGHSLGLIELDKARRINCKSAPGQQKLANRFKDSEDLSDIFKKSFLLGRLFARAGTEPTVFNILGLGL